MFGNCRGVYPDLRWIQTFWTSWIHIRPPYFRAYHLTYIISGNIDPLPPPLCWKLEYNVSFYLVHLFWTRKVTRLFLHQLFSLCEFRHNNTAFITGKKLDIWDNLFVSLLYMKNTTFEEKNICKSLISHYFFSEFTKVFPFRPLRPLLSLKIQDLTTKNIYVTFLF